MEVITRKLDRAMNIQIPPSFASKIPPASSRGIATIRIQSLTPPGQFNPKHTAGSWRP